ncbi:MAG: hypothetical protein PHD32_01510 [Eubacteriales bacterium]|nr:hypothetical protein [Eubacteriales bacterium]
MKHCKHTNIAKVLTVTLAALVVCSGVGVAAYATGLKSGTGNANTASSGTAADQNYKDETVYVIAAADGTPQKVIVSDWLRNNTGSASLSDYSELGDVTNVNGDETYVMNGEHMRVWDAQGGDICYQGETDKELPVSLSVQYKLDGDPISPEVLAGKSGRITMRFNYTNNQSEVVEIDGEKQTVVVPFAMITGMILDNDRFSNITVTNGRVINDGNRTIVAGFAIPGLQKDLGLDEDTLSLPEYVEISADVKDFALTTTLTLASNGVFDAMDAEKTDNLDELFSSVGQLTDAMDQLMDGSSALYGGMSTLLEKSGDLISGIDQLVSGAKKLAAGAGDADNGAALLHTKLSELSAGLTQLTSKNSDLNNGAQQVFASLLSAADSQIAASGLTLPKLTMENYATVLNGAIASLDESSVRQQATNTARSQVEAGVRAQEATIRAGVEAAVRQSVLENVLAAQPTPMTVAQYTAAVNAGTIDPAVQTQVETAVDTQMSGKTSTIDTQTEAKIQSLISQQMQDPTIQGRIEAAVAAAKKGSGSLAQLKAQLDNYDVFYQGVLAYTSNASKASDGASQLLAGSKTLSDGAAQVSDGASQLYAGLLKLQSSSSALTNGVTELTDGAMQLSDGIKELNEKGVQKLVDAAGGDLKGLTTRLRATLDVTKDYRSFTGVSDDMNGDVKFVYRTESVGNN